MFLFSFAAVRKQLVLAEQYKQLKEKGQLDSYMKKKRRKISEKGKANIPTGTP